MRPYLRSYVFLLLLSLALTACDSMPTWLGGHKKEAPKLEGTQIPVLPETAKLTPDKTLAATPAVVPEATENKDWPQRLAQGNPALAVSLEHRQSARAGDGNSFDYKLVPSPVIGDGVLFAMDADGHISAHDVKNVSEVRWISPGVASRDDEAVMGGGLAYANGHVYAASGKGLVVSLDAKTGLELWRQALNTPIRSAPAVAGDRVFAVTDDSQLFALDARSGAVLWSHRGVNEGTGFLIEASPVATDDAVIAPYASGEVYVLRPENGDVQWSDTVAAPQRDAAGSVFNGIGGNPVAVDGLLYVAGGGGELAAFDLAGGRRVWEQPVSSVATPWVAGDYLYVLTNDGAVVAFQRMDGRVRWVRQLRMYKDQKDKKGRYTWNGPVMAGGRLLVAGAHGTMMELSPQDGSVLSETGIPEGVYTPPVVAGGVLYLVGDDATLYALY